MTRIEFTGRRARSNYTHFPCRGQTSNLNRQTRRPNDSAPHRSSLKTYTVIFFRTLRIFSSVSGNSGADDDALVNLGRFCVHMQMGPGYSNAEMSRPPTALT
jgi:hypothetical protein